MPKRTDIHSVLIMGGRVATQLNCMKPGLRIGKNNQTGLLQSLRWPRRF